MSISIIACSRQDSGVWPSAKFANNRIALFRSSVDVTFALQVLCKGSERNGQLRAIVGGLRSHAACFATVMELQMPLHMQAVPYSIPSCIAQFNAARAYTNRGLLDQKKCRTKEC